MKTKKIIRYRIPISRTFPSTHKRAGNPTVFIEKIKYSLNDDISYKTPCNSCDRFKIKIPCNECCELSPKLHTIRKNYPLWKKRFKKIMSGEAVLELYYWSGKPYNSKCVTICQLGKDDGIGLQKLEFSASGLIGMIKIDDSFPDNEVYDINEISQNDGLSFDDFKEWVRGYDLSEPLVIIHFTSFRY